MEKEKINQIILITIIVVLLIAVGCFVIYAFLINSNKTSEQIQVKINQIYSSEYNITALDTQYFIGTYEDHKISVIIDSEGQEVYQSMDDIYYDHIYKMKNGNYLIYNNLDNTLNTYIFDGEKVSPFYKIADVSYVKPILYKNEELEYIVGFASMTDDALFLYNLDNSGIVVVEDVSLVGDYASDNVYYTYQENRLVVKKNDGLMGVIDLSGKVILDYQYKNIMSTYHDSYIVQNQKDKYGILDKSGETLLKSSYQAIYSFSHYYVVVNTSNKMALYDTSYHNLTGFQMYYDPLLPFYLRSNINSVQLYEVHGKIVVVNNYLEDVNKTEYEKHNLYVLDEKGNILKNIQQIGFDCTKTLYSYDKDYRVSLYDSSFAVIREISLEDVYKIDEVLSVSATVVQVKYENGQGEQQVRYFQEDGQEIEMNLGDNLFYKDLYSGYLKEEEDSSTFTIYDSSLQEMDSLKGKNIQVIGDYIIADHSIYKIIII